MSDAEFLAINGVTRAVAKARLPRPPELLALRRLKELQVTEKFGRRAQKRR